MIKLDKEKQKKAELILLIEAVVATVLAIFAIFSLFNSELSLIVNILFLVYTLILTYNYLFVMKKKTNAIIFIIVDIVMIATIIMGFVK